MSIQSEINRIAQNVSDSFDAVAAKGGTRPQAQNSSNLPDAILSIPAAGVQSFNGRTGDVEPQEEDYTAEMVGAQPTINVSGILKGNGSGGVSAAVAGTDYANGETQAKVMATTVPSRNESVAASDLQALLDSLPKFLNDSIKIFVTGEVTTQILISGFHGSGQFDLRMNGATLHGGMKIENCSVKVIVNNCVLDTANLSVRDALIVTKSDYVCLQGVTLTGDGTNNHWGIACGNGSHVSCNECTINNFGRAVLCSEAAIIDFAQGTYSGNAYGAHVWHGGIVMLSEGAPDTLSGASNIKDGGIIVKANGTLL